MGVDAYRSVRTGADGCINKYRSKNKEKRSPNWRAEHVFEYATTTAKVKRFASDTYRQNGARHAHAHTKLRTNSPVHLIPIVKQTRTTKQQKTHPNGRRKQHNNKSTKRLKQNRQQKKNKKHKKGSNKTQQAFTQTCSIVNVPRKHNERSCQSKKRFTWSNTTADKHRRN